MTRLFALLLIALVAPASAAPAIPFPVHERVLDNGLQVVVVPFDSPGVVAFHTVVRTGSRDEVEPGHSGFAHFFEHMMFRGTPRFSTEAYNDALKRMGADSNAYTTDDYTNYFIVAPSRHLEAMMDLESDRFRNLRYDEEVFKTEALAVLGEYNKNASNPMRAMHERLRELAFTRHTYRHTTMGFLADIKAMPGYFEYSLGFFRRFYRPENAALLIVGDVTPDAAFALAERFWAPWERGYEAPAVTPEPPAEAGARDHLEWPLPTRPYLLEGYRAPAFTTESADTAALGIIDQLLFSPSAPLYQELVVDKQWVDWISGSPPTRRDPSLFMISAQARKDELVPEVQKAVLRHIEALKAAPVDADRLERTRSHLRYALARRLDSPADVAMIVSDSIGRTGSAHAVNALYDRYAEVTPEDIQRVAREVFTAKNRTAVTLATRPTPGATP
ncbi:MAG: protease [Myxococcales bacterium]